MALHVMNGDPHEKIVEEATQAVLSTVDLAVVLERTGALLERHFGATRVVIHRLDAQPPGQAMVALVADPRHADVETGRVFALAGTAAGRAVERQAPVVVDPIDPARPRFGDEPRLAALGYGSLVAFPLVFEGQVLGVLEIAHPPSDGLLDCCFQVARRVASLVAIALHNSLLVEEVKRLNGLLGKENAQLRQELRQLRKESRYVAESGAMKAVVAQVQKVAASDTTVLIRGETGSGKEGLARMVHDSRPASRGPSSPSTWPPSPRGWSSRSSSGTRRGPSPARCAGGPGASRRPRAGPSSSTRWATRRRACSCACSACCRSAS